MLPGRAGRGAVRGAMAVSLLWGGGAIGCQLALGFTDFSSGGGVDANIPDATPAEAGGAPLSAGAAATEPKPLT